MDLSMAGSKRRSGGCDDGNGGGGGDDGELMNLSPKKRANLDDGEGGKQEESNNGKLNSLNNGVVNLDIKQGAGGAGAGGEATLTPEGLQNIKDLSGFTLGSVLSNRADLKLLTVEGKFPDGQAAVVVLEKKTFAEEDFKELFSAKSKLNRIFQNDIYGNYDCAPAEKTAAIKATVVYPATPKHIEKYKHQEVFLVDETAELYEKVTLPHIEGSQFNIQWVFNILEHKKEADRIVFEDYDQKTGFILLPDLKWDGKTVENLYLCAIVHTRGVKSLRDLTADHLPLLKNLLESGCKAIKEKYGLTRSQLRIFLHYQPSYYHFHVHFTSLDYFAPGIYTEKSHLLQTVISNIETKSEYYKDAILPFVVKKNDLLYSKLVDFGYQF